MDGTVQVIDAEHNVSLRGDVNRVDVDVGLRHHEHQVAKHARLVQYLDDKYLPLTISNPSRVENPSSLLRISGNEVDKAVTFATHPLDRFDIDRGLTEHLPESSQRAGSVLQRDVELNWHSVWPSVRWALQRITLGVGVLLQLSHGTDAV